MYLFAPCFVLLFQVEYTFEFIKILALSIIKEWEETRP